MFHATNGVALRLPAVLSALLVALVAAALSLPRWIEPVRWSDPDAIYYQAKTLAFRGENERSALYRLFSSPIANELRRSQYYRPFVTDRNWIEYGRRFFRRRLIVPLMAATLYPVFGSRSLLTVSLLGYVLLALALYALLRRRFSSGVSAAVTIACVVAPPVRLHSFVPMTDSWGLVLETCAILAASLTLDRGLRWLAAWVAVIAVLSLTRDNTVVPLVGVLCLMIHQRDRRSVLLVATGIAAAIPAPLILGNGSIRENLAFTFNGFMPPTDHSWGFVLRGYWPNLHHLVGSDLGSITRHHGWHAVLWYAGAAAAAAGVILLIKSLRSDDGFIRLLCYSLVGGIVFVALYGVPSALREELVLIPPIAVGSALMAEQVLLPRVVNARRRRLIRLVLPGRHGS